MQGSRAAQLLTIEPKYKEKGERNGETRCTFYSITSENVNFDLLQYYVVQWCKSRINNLQYCYMDDEHSIHVSERNFTVDGVLASSTYKIIAYAVTADAGSGQKSIIPKTVPPLNLKVSYAYSYMSGARYGLQVYLSWNSVHASEPVVSNKHLCIFYIILPSITRTFFYSLSISLEGSNYRESTIDCKQIVISGP